jgi:hypothetical protein
VEIVEIPHSLYGCLVSLPTLNELLKLDKKWRRKRFSCNVDQLIVSRDLLESDNTLRHMLPEVMESCVDVLGPWTHLGQAD